MVQLRHRLLGQPPLPDGVVTGLVEQQRQPEPQLTAGPGRKELRRHRQQRVQHVLGVEGLHRRPRELERDPAPLLVVERRVPQDLLEQADHLVVVSRPAAWSAARSAAVTHASSRPACRR